MVLKSRLESTLHYISRVLSYLVDYWKHVSNSRYNQLIETMDLLTVIQCFCNGMFPLLVGMIIGRSFRLWSSS